MATRSPCRECEKFKDCSKECNQLEELLPHPKSGPKMAPLVVVDRKRSRDEDEPNGDWPYEDEPNEDVLTTRGGEPRRLNFTEDSGKEIPPETDSGLVEPVTPESEEGDLLEPVTPESEEGDLLEPGIPESEAGEKPVKFKSKMINDPDFRQELQKLYYRPQRWSAMSDIIVPDYEFERLRKEYVAPLFTRKDDKFRSHFVKFLKCTPICQIAREAECSTVNEQKKFAKFIYKMAKRMLDDKTYIDEQIRDEWILKFESRELPGPKDVKDHLIIEIY